MTPPLKNILFRAANIAEVVKNKEIRYSYIYRYEPSGKGYYIKGKEIIGEKEFNEKYPIEIKAPPPKGDNPDKSKNWIYDRKAY